MAAEVPAARLRTARTLVLSAAVLTLLEVPLVTWAPGLALALGLWAALLLALARLPARAPGAAGWTLAALAAMSSMTTIGWLSVPADERILFLAFWAHAAISLVHSALLWAAAVALLQHRLQARWHTRRRVDWGDPALGGARLVAAGLALWAAALALLFPWWFNALASLEAAALAPAALALLFLLVPRLRPWHARLAGAMAWLALLTLIGVWFVPVAYGTIGIYLALSARGVIVLLCAMAGTALLFVGRRAVRAALAATAPPSPPAAASA